VPALEYPYAIVKGRRSPLIPIGLGFQGKRQWVEAYGDSKAFYSVFKAGLAPALGLDWQQGARIYVQVGDGGFIPVYLHTVDMQLRHYRFSGQIGFSEHLGVSFNVIGRIPLFERCIVCFDDRQGLVRLEPYSLS
jgi:hypothetical protein